jgi:hypothetical protein
MARLMVAGVLLAGGGFGGVGCGAAAAKSELGPSSGVGQGELGGVTPAYKAPQTEEVATIDGASQWLDRSEQELRAALGPARGEPGVTSVDRSGAAGAAPAEPGAPSPLGEAPGAGGMAPGQGAQPHSADRCAIACEALTSMKNAASRLCGLAGEDDARCARAGERVAQARELVRSACSACAAAATG